MEKEEILQEFSRLIEYYEFQADYYQNERKSFDKEFFRALYQGKQEVYENIAVQLRMVHQKIETNNK